MRFLLKSLLSAGLALFLGAGIAFTYGAYVFFKPMGGTQDRLVYIPFGTNVPNITAQLYQEGFISNKNIFDLGLRITGKAPKLKAGEYSIPAGASMKQVKDIIVSGRTYQRYITIAEGLSSYQIVQRLNENPFMKDKIETLPREGTLLPETYDYTRGQSRKILIRRMQQKMRDTLEDAWAKRAPNLPIKTKDEALVLASIIEKETAIARERRRVAGVFTNRLRKGMRLQTDPTVIYAINKGKHEENGKGPLGRRLLYRDLEVDDPYNTYRYAGLPPGPIANPGKASIEAALDPEKHDYIYFVADGTGGHIFAKTLAEHNRNVANWRKIRGN